MVAPGLGAWFSGIASGLTGGAVGSMGTQAATQAATQTATGALANSAVSAVGGQAAGYAGPEIIQANLGQITPAMVQTMNPAQQAAFGALDFTSVAPGSLGTSVAGGAGGGLGGFGDIVDKGLNYADKVAPLVDGYFKYQGMKDSKDIAQQNVDIVKGQASMQREQFDRAKAKDDKREAAYNSFTW